MEHFITEIQIRQLLHLSNLKISLSSHDRQNLILTGKNGSGKTTLLRTLESFLCHLSLLDENGQDRSCPPIELKTEDGSVIQIECKPKKENGVSYRLIQYFFILNGIHIEVSTTEDIKKMLTAGEFIIAYYPAERRTLFDAVNGVEDVKLKTYYGIEEDPGALLLKYMVHLKTQQAYAASAGDEDTVKLIQAWFARFEGALRILLDADKLYLEYQYKEYCFWIVEDSHKRYTFNQLSDGYSAVIRIVSDLILRMDHSWLQQGALNCYDTEGIVLIDELETHLHIDLQRKILPFLTAFFPRIQFIVSTHSPYVLNSISNAMVYDMEKNIAVEDMSGYSAEGIVEGYFDMVTYSEEIKRKLQRYEELAFLKELSEEERAERARLRAELSDLSGQLSGEAKAAFEEIEDRRKRND